MNWQLLRQTIIAALGTELGQYTLPNGTTVPAVAISEAGDYPPTGTTCVGLEVVVTPAVKLTHTRNIGSSYWGNETIEIAIKQWDLSKSTVAAIRLLLPALPAGIVKIFPRVMHSPELDNIETTRIEFTLV